MSNNKGFTLIEMLVVIAIIGIVAAIAIGNYYSHRQNRQLSRASRDVYSTLQSAKMKAIRDNTNILVQFTPGVGNLGTYQVFEDLDADNVFDPGERGLGSGQMPPAINLLSAVFTLSPAPSSIPANMTRFTPLGLASDKDGTVTITNGNNTAAVVVGVAGDIRVDY